jgi:hypothetical protein
MSAICRVAKRLPASQAGRCFLEWFLLDNHDLHCCPCSDTSHFTAEILLSDEQIHGGLDMRILTKPLGMWPATWISRCSGNADFVFEMCPIRTSAGTLAFLTEDFSVFFFFRFMKEEVGIVPRFCHACFLPDAFQLGCGVGVGWNFRLSRR